MTTKNRNVTPVGAGRLSGAVLKVTVPALGSILVYAVAFYAIFLPTFRESLMDQKRAMIQEEVQIAWDVVNSLYLREQAREFDRAQAQELALATLHGMRFGPDGKDYFWVNDLQVTMLMHPYRPDLEGEDVSLMPDANGKLLFKEFARVATSEAGEGYVDYVWQWQDDATRLLPKVSYVKLFEPWQWIIGHGVYIEDVREEIKAISGRVNQISLALAVVIFLLGAWVAFTAYRGELARRQAQRDAATSRRQMSDIIDFLPEATMVVDKDHRVIVWNRAMAEMTSLPAEEMIGKTKSAYALPFYGEERPLLIDLVLESDEEIEKRYDFIHRDGDLLHAEVKSPITGRYLAANAGPLRNASGEIVGAVETILDVTRKKEMEGSRKELERQLQRAQRLESIGTVTGGIAHDFNNLLTPILGYTELLLLQAEQAGDEECQKILGSVHVAADRARELTSQLLAFSRRQPMRVSTLNLNHVINGIDGIMRGSLREDIDLRLDLGRKLHPIRGDSGQLEQVVMNLVVNAQDAMPGGGKLAITTDNTLFDEAYVSDNPDAVEGPHIQLIISDTGAGISAEHLDRIFEPFFTTKEQDHGTGLGLATVMGIVQQHAGHVRVDSEAGIGTTFRIFFPATSMEALAEAIPSAGDPLIGGEESILVVEDEPMVRQLTESLLTRYGYTVFATGAPEEAFAFASGDARLDLLLSDIIMPEINGKELHRRLVEIRPGLPVLYMSGYTGDVISHLGILLGDVQIVPKPFRVDELLQKVREVLDAQ